MTTPEILDRFVIVGSGCSGAVPLCNHLFRAIRRDTQVATLTTSLSDGSSTDMALSGSEGPCSSSDPRDQDSDCQELQSMSVPDIEDIPVPLWSSQLHTIAPHFERFTRDLIGAFQNDTKCRCQKITKSPLDHIERRNNVSCLVQIGAHAQTPSQAHHLKNGETNGTGSLARQAPSDFSNILIDVGKTFRDAILRVLVPLEVTTIDQVLLTHGHADAMGGLDDLREFQTHSTRVYDGSVRHVCHRALPIACHKKTAEEATSKFEYCFYSDDWKVLPNGEIIMKSRWPAYRIEGVEDSARHQTTDDCTSMDPAQKMGRELRKLMGERYIQLQNGSSLLTRFYPCFHGGSYVSLGFGFGERDRVLYLSDIKTISMEVLKRICQDGPWKLLVIDCLSPIKFHYSHATLYEALQFTRAINPEIVRLVGMTCIFSPSRTKALCQKWIRELTQSERSKGRGLCGINEDEYTRIAEVELGYDGEVFEYDLAAISRSSPAL